MSPRASRHLTAPPPPVAPADRFKRLELPDDDFPYYQGWPVWISGSQWALVLVVLAAAFGFLVVSPLNGDYSIFITAIVFSVVPVVGLYAVAHPGWTAIFRRLTWRHFMWGVVFGLINIVVSWILGAIVSAFVGTTANAATTSITDKAAPEIVAKYASVAIQLFGEELLTILPLLALMYLFAAKMHWSRKKALVWAWIISAIIFALVHLPTYDWNIVQCLVVIGGARLILSLAYIKTKNIWVSTIAHILNDWVLLTLPFFSIAVNNSLK
jgi:membrane protease YdiL (CAAX protease family)